mgnify:CR=1 FL=1
MKFDPLKTGRMPVSIETISALRNLFGARAESTLFSIVIDGKVFVGSAMLRENPGGGLSLLLNPSKDDIDKWDGRFDWDAYFRERIVASEPGTPLAPLVPRRRAPPVKGNLSALEGGDAA